MFLKVDYLLRGNDRHCLMENEKTLFNGPFDKFESHKNKSNAGDDLHYLALFKQIEIFRQDRHYVFPSSTI